MGFLTIFYIYIAHFYCLRKKKKIPLLVNISVIISGCCGSELKLSLAVYCYILFPPAPYTPAVIAL